VKQPLIGIIGGNGKMGQLFASFFQEQGIKVLISDLKTKLSNKELAVQADIVIVSVPIDKTEKIIKEIAPHLPKSSALTDFSSIKEMPIKAMLKAKCEVFGMHPMFGESNPIPGQTIIFCPTNRSGHYYKWLKNFFTTKGAKIEEMTASRHDKLMAQAQGQIHFAEIAFANALRRSKLPTKELLKFSSKASELKVMLAARLLNQSSNLYGNIQIQNKNNLKALKNLQKASTELLQIVKKKDLKAFIKYFNSTAKFYGKYTNEAHKESSELIDFIIEKRNRKKRSKPSPKPQKNSLALLGPANTYSDIAANTYDSTSPKYYCKDIPEVFELIVQGKVKEGIVPLENSIHGTIRESFDNLFSKNVHIAREISLEIHHNLIILAHAKKSDIKTIISHPQALAQCKKYLKKHFPKAEIQAFPSTAAAIEKLICSNKKEIAVIASKEAADLHNLKIHAKDIEDSKNNKTSFIIIRKGPFKSTTNQKASKTSIAFHFGKDSPGSLLKIFKLFGDAKINLSRIESRPTTASRGDYIFFLDFQGPLTILNKVKKQVAKLKILGSY